MFVLPGAGARAASLIAAVDRNVVPVGETITLSLVFSGVNANAPPALPPLPNFRPAGPPSYSSQISIVNGASSVNITFQYVLVATQPGTAQIPAISSVVGGQALTSQPIGVRVTPAGEAMANQGAATQPAFVRLVAPRTEVYLGEPFAVEVHLYFRNASEPQMQVRADGFTLSPLNKPTSQSRTVVGQTQFNVAIFRIIARAARAGALKLGPVEGTITVFTRVDFFQRPMDARSIGLSSETIPIQVLPLPREGAPSGFNGTIGTYQLQVDAGPTSVSVGDPVTVRVRISGQGPLDALTYPEQADWRDFNTYPATSAIASQDPLLLSGTKSFEQVVIPQNHEIKSLPPFKFSFFDPQAKQYRTLSSAPIPLSIRPSAGSATPPPVLTNATVNAEAPREDDLIHIRPHLDLAESSTAAPLVGRPGFLALQAVPVLFWAGLLVRRIRSESLANNPRRRRQREVAQRIREGLEELNAHAAGGQSDEFFALLFRLLQEQLGERLDLPSSAITESVIDDRLQNRGLSADATKALHELFQICNQARYAPVRDRQELAALIPKLEGVLRNLQSMTP